MPAPTNSTESAAGFQASTPQGGGAAALQYQHFTTDSNAHGFLGGTLGRGNRNVPSPGSFFSAPPRIGGGRNLSGGQFGQGHAHSVLDSEDDEE